MSASDLVAQLATAGTPPELLAAVAKELFEGEIERAALAERRKHERERKARSRSVTGRDVPSQEVTQQGSPEVPPPAPPLPNPSNSAPYSPPILEEKKTAIGSCLKRAYPLELPDWMPESFAEFVAMRKRMRNVPFEPGAQRRCVQKLTKLRAEGHDPEKLISKAIENGHRTFFPDDSTRAGPGTKHMTAQELREKAEWFIRYGMPDRADECRRKAIAIENRAAA
jgi:hypothetical protein